MPATVLPSGKVEFIPQEHTLCGLCRNSFMLCTCGGVGHAQDYVLVGLPPPPQGATQAQLIQRWCSLVYPSMSMGTFNADQWYQDNVNNLLFSMNARADALTNMVEDYITTALPNDPSTLASLTQVFDGKSQAIAVEVRATLAIFLAGDWACLTFVGAILLSNAFQTSDPQRYRLDDAHLQVVFQHGVGLISSVMKKGFDNRGFRLAMECDRAPCTNISLPSSTQRLNG